MRLLFHLRPQWASAECMLLKKQAPLRIHLLLILHLHKLLTEQYLLRLLSNMHPIPLFPTDQTG